MQIEANNFSIAVLGAGTMGQGIAQIAGTAGHPVMLYDVSNNQILTAIENISSRLERSVKNGKLGYENKNQILANICPAKSLEELSKAKLVIEAIIEDMVIKQEVFSQLESLLETDAILATNTSSIDLNKMCSILKRPDRLVGMHFFNPVPVMSLVEVIRSIETNTEVADFIFSLAQQWGKSPVHVLSSPGFIVNRVARPFYSEALSILKEGGTDAATLDAIIRECGGFKMGPFELMDLIGLDVNYMVTHQIWESFQRHPRFAPSLLQKKLVDAGRLGRKSEHGFFEYGVNAKLQDPKNEMESPAPESLTIEGPEKLPESLLKLIESGAMKIKKISGSGIIRLPAGAVVVLSNGKSSSERSTESLREIVSLDLCLNYVHSTRIALSHSSKCSEINLQEAVGLFQSFNKKVTVLNDIPGMVLTRTIAMLANEASFLVQEKIADAAGINLAMRKGINFPQGPLEWAEQWGLRSVVETLNNLKQVYGKRYQVSTRLQQKAYDF